MQVLGTIVTYKPGDRTVVCGPDGASSGYIPCMIIKEATYEDYINQIPPPTKLPSADVAKISNYYFISID
jgi:hypothetical protein